jgi:NADPH-dependent 2,4-dienoyl-CoA reductase/sulfur reductase-like enzyme
MTTVPSDRVGAASSPATFDVAVIGAGPAGLAASAAAVEGGARVALVDAGPRLGGQYWRHRDDDDGARHHDWPAFLRLARSLAAARETGRLVHLAGHAVWHVERDADGFTVHALVADEGREVRARTLVVATGAYDRQLPFPGWTLPGVYTAGAAQAMLKGQGVLVGRRIAVGGSGPFLLSVAAGLADAGATVVGVFEAGRPTAFARHPLTTLRARSKLVEGAGYVRALRRRGVRYRTRSAVIEALGTDEVTGVRVARLDASWRAVPGSERTIGCDAVAVGYGFTPQVELPIQLGCEMAMDRDRSLVVRVDDRQRSSEAGVYVAGEACGVGGAELALAEGELAGLHAAAGAAGHEADPHRLGRPEARRARGRAFAAALHEAFAVRPGWRTWLAGDTIVCRCEEVAVDAIHEAVDDLGAEDARTAKLFARPGMGLCQGRVCGFSSAALVAARCGREVTAADLAGTSARPIAQPVPLSVLVESPHAPPAPPGDR